MLGGKHCVFVPSHTSGLSATQTWILFPETTAFKSLAKTSEKANRLISTGLIRLLFAQFTHRGGIKSYTMDFSTASKANSNVASSSCLLCGGTRIFFAILDRRQDSIVNVICMRIIYFEYRPMVLYFSAFIFICTCTLHISYADRCNGWGSSAQEWKEWGLCVHIYIHIFTMKNG